MKKIQFLYVLDLFQLFLEKCKVISVIYPFFLTRGGVYCIINIEVDNMKNKKLILSHIFTFILGAIIFGGSAYVIATEIASSSVAYTENGQTTVEGALTDLYSKADNWIDPSYIDFGTLATNTNKTILASKNGVCIKRNNKVSCFKINNYEEEQNHIQQVFSDISCTVDSSRVTCNASDFRCQVYSNGLVTCTDRSDNSGCSVSSESSRYCS